MGNNKIKKAVCILSGGMDSTLCSYIAKQNGYEIIAVHFNYGQRTQKRELKAFRDICKSLHTSNTYEIDLDFFNQIGASALTDTAIEIPIDGVEDGVPSTYVPFRNGIFLSIAGAIAEKENAEVIYIGVIEEDSSGYPDCRNTFIKKMEDAINSGTKDETKVLLKTPLIDLMKSEIVEKSIKLEVPLHLTWSCYKNSQKACGICDSCRLRLNGFKKAGISDKIEYEKENIE